MVSSDSAEKVLSEVAGTLLNEKKVLITTHIKPDGDALGCLIAMHHAMTAIGADSAMYISGSRVVAPEYDFLGTLDEVLYGAPPEDSPSRTLIAVDCGNAERIGNDELVEQAPRIINIDHHSDNSRFGDLNLVAGSASSTSEIIYFILQKMGVELSEEMAQAIYTGILMDSGRFQYASTTPATLRVAADLISLGVDHTAIFHHVYETVPVAKARLQCRMLDNMVISYNGRLAIGVLEQEDFRAAGAGADLTDGLINHLRELEGVEVAALIYAMSPDEESSEPFYRVSLRSSGEGVNVQSIARAMGGGGHRQAAGFSATGETAAELVRFITEESGKALSDH